MANQVLFRALGRLARWPLAVLIRPNPKLNSLVWDAQYAMGMWDYLDHTSDGDRPLTSIERYIPNASILDLGCGTSANLPLAPGRFQHYHGVDISRAAIKRARALRRPNTSYEVADILSYQTSQRYDAILLREVLYYFPTDQVAGLLQRLSAMLAPGGRILITLYDVTSPSALEVVAAIRLCGLRLEQEVAEETTTIFVLASHAVVS